MVRRLVTIPPLMDGPHGTVGVHEASRLGVATTIHSCLFWFDCADVVLCRRGKSIIILYCAALHLFFFFFLADDTPKQQLTFE